MSDTGHVLKAQRTWMEPRDLKDNPGGVSLKTEQTV